MNNQDMFKDEYKIQANWFKFLVIGDNIQGTLIGRRQTLNRLSGKMQWIYEIKGIDNQINLIGGTAVIDRQMQYVRLGQVIGFKFLETRPNKEPGRKPTKIIQLYANPNIVDKEWMESREQEAFNQFPGATVEEDIPFGDEEPKPSITKPLEETKPLDKDETIRNLAQLKLGVTDPTQVKTKVMEALGLAYIESNLDQIIEKLKTM